MRKKLQRSGVILLTAAFTLSSVPLSAMADTARKTNQLISSAANRYEVTVCVPGEELSLYDEIIIMVDRSGNRTESFEALKQAILQIGEDVLSSTGNTRLTLMSLGLSGRTVIEKASTYEQLARTVDGLTRSDLYDGVDETNCEAGFTYISDYINASSDLNKATVFYISDSEASASDEPIVWDAWDTDEYGYMRGKKGGDYFKQDGDSWVPNEETSYTVDEVIALTMGYEVQNFCHGGTLAPATIEIFGEAFAEISETAVDESDIYAYVNPLLQEDPDQDGITLGKEWIDLVWEQAYDAAGMTIGTPYAYSQVKRAFEEYDLSANETWLMSFFYATYGYKAHFEDIHSDYTLSEGSWYYYRYKKGQRAAVRATELSEQEKVENLYLLGVGLIYGGSCYESWMMPTEDNKANETAYVYAEGEKIQSRICGNMADVCDQLVDYVSEMAVTPYQDVVVTDYTRHGVTLLPETVKVYDGNYVICYYNKTTKTFEWTPGVTPLTDKTPITVEVAAPVDGAVSGENTDDAAYKITWNVKDGSLLSSDDFRLCYEVIVNDMEENAVTSTVQYYDTSGVLHQEEIEVLQEAVLVSESEEPQDSIVIEDNDTPLGVYEIEDHETPLGALPEIEETGSTTDAVTSVISMVSIGVDRLITTGYNVIFGKKTVK